jgi:hypothetical protein
MSLKSLSDNPHAKLLFIWSALDLILLSAGILTVIASICFHRPRQLILNLVFDDIHFVCKLPPFYPLLPDPISELIAGGLVLGSAYIAACIFSIPAILLGKGRLWALKALNWGLVILIIANLLVSLLLSRRVRKREREWDEGEEQDEGLISVRKLDMVLLSPATPGIM